MTTWSFCLGLMAGIPLGVFIMCLLILAGSDAGPSLE
jgi:hypothetical protein